MNRKSNVLCSFFSSSSVSYVSFSRSSTFSTSFFCSSSCSSFSWSFSPPSSPDLLRLLWLYLTRQLDSVYSVVHHLFKYKQVLLTLHDNVMKSVYVYIALFISWCKIIATFNLMTLWINNNIDNFYQSRTAALNLFRLADHFWNFVSVRGPPRLRRKNIHFPGKNFRWPFLLIPQNPWIS